MNVELKILNPIIQNHLPQYQTQKAAGLDLHACLNENVILKPFETKIIPTGIAIDLKNENTCAMIFPRSGLSTKHGIVLKNSTGIIDADYQGEIQIALYNLSQQEFTIEPFMRIAQMIIMPIIRCDFKIVNHFEKTNRGEKGFGSTDYF